MLPGCTLDKIRSYLQSIGYSKVVSLSNTERETWVSPDNFNTIRFPVDEDPMDFDNVVVLMEIQLKGYVGQIPYYAGILSQRFDAEGRGPSC